MIIAAIMGGALRRERAKRLVSLERHTVRYRTNDMPTEIPSRANFRQILLVVCSCGHIYINSLRCSRGCCDGKTELGSQLFRIPVPYLMVVKYQHQRNA